MKLSTVILYVFFISSFIATLGSAFDSGSLMLLGKPFVVPSLIFYYFVESKIKSPLVFLICAFNFVGESIAIFDFSAEISYLIVPFFLANICIIYFILTTGKIKKVTLPSYLILGFILLILSFFWYLIYRLFLDRNFIFILEIALYGITLVVLGILESYKIMMSINNSSNYLLLYASTLIISGTFYVLYYYQFPIKMLDIIHFVCQMVSHLFLILFILNQENYLIQKNKNK